MNVQRTAAEIASVLEPGDLDVFQAQRWNDLPEHLQAAERLQRANLISPNATGTRRNGWLQRYRTALANEIGFPRGNTFVLSPLGLAIQANLNALAALPASVRLYGPNPVAVQAQLAQSHHWRCENADCPGKDYTRECDCCRGWWELKGLFAP